MLVLFGTKEYPVFFLFFFFLFRRVVISDRVKKERFVVGKAISETPLRNQKIKRKKRANRVF